MESGDLRAGRALMSVSFEDADEDAGEQEGYVMPDVSSFYLDAVGTDDIGKAKSRKADQEEVPFPSGKTGNVMTASQLSSTLIKGKSAAPVRLGSGAKSSQYHEPDVSLTTLSAADMAPRKKAKKPQEDPDVSLSSISEYWDARRRSLMAADKERDTGSSAAVLQNPLTGRKPVGEMVHGLRRSEQDAWQGRGEDDVSHMEGRLAVAAGAQVAGQRGEAADGEQDVYSGQYDDYELLDEQGVVIMRPSRRLLDRANGVSEMPDPEAAEYLTEHESKGLKDNLGSDTVSIAKTHYNHTHVQAGAHPDHHTAEAASNRYSFQQADDVTSEATHGNPIEASVAKREEPQPLKDMPKAEIEAKRPIAERGEAGPLDKQTGYAWFGEFPPPGFPEWDLTKRSVLFTQKEAEAKRMQAEAEKAAAAKKEEEAKLAAKRAEDAKKAAATVKPAGDPPGDGGVLEKSKQARDVGGGGIIHAAAGKEAVAAQAARDLIRKRVASKVWMSPQEIAIVETHLDPNDTMLEWGSGYSTLWFSQFVREYYSIEHDEGWWKEMKDQINVTGNVHYLGVPVAKGHKGWGGGFEEGTYQQFEEYIKAVDNFKVNRFDKVLIDGRARAFCAEYVLKYLHADSLVFIHDYHDRFFYHGTVDKYYDKVVETFEGQSIVVIRPKKEALLKARKDAVSALGDRKLG